MANWITLWNENFDEYNYELNGYKIDIITIDWMNVAAMAPTLLMIAIVPDAVVLKTVGYNSLLSK